MSRSEQPYAAPTRPEQEVRLPSRLPPICEDMGGVWRSSWSAAGVPCWSWDTDFWIGLLLTGPRCPDGYATGDLCGSG